MKKFAIILALSFTGCATTSRIKMADLQEGQWRAKALIKDKEQGRSYIVNLNLNAIRNERVRMDVTSTLGTGVAALVVNTVDVRYLLIDSKRFYFGQPQPDVMRPILSLPFDPRWLQNLLFEEALPDKSWSCTMDSRGLLQSCKDSVTHVVIMWADRNGEKRTVLIEHPKASVQIKFSSFKPKVEDRKNLFLLEAPEGFQKLRVR